MKKVLLSISVLGMLSSNIYGSCNSTSCTDKITKIYTTATGTIYIGTSGNEKALNCAAGAGNGGVSNVYVSINPNSKGANAIYSLILTAKSLNKKVSLRIKENSSLCEIIYASLEN